MKDGTVLLFEPKADAKGFDKLLGKAIAFFTGSPYTHTAIYLVGCTYDSTVWHEKGKVLPRSGVRRTEGLGVPGAVAAMYLQPMQPLSAGESMQMLKAIGDSMLHHRPYNVLKLLVLAIVYPTRKFWTWIGWVPFQADFWGEVCSEFVDELYTTAGRDLFPGRSEQATVPGDWMLSNEFTPVYL